MSSKLAATGLFVVASYFGFHALAGEQGASSLEPLEARVESQRERLADIQRENDALRSRIQRLTPGTVDPDLVEALARRDLGFAYPDEVILIEAPSDRAQQVSAAF